MKGVPDAPGKAEIVPLTLKEARRYVAEHHRHNEPPIGHRFSIGLERDGALIGVVVAGHPQARMADDGRTLELLRLTTEGDRNACSRLYSAACRAAEAMGYRKVITYTLDWEPGSSLRASGFIQDGSSPGGEWKHTDGPRSADRPTLFDPPKDADRPETTMGPRFEGSTRCSLRARTSPRIRTTTAIRRIPATERPPSHARATRYAGCWHIYGKPRARSRGSGCGTCSRTMTRSSLMWWPPSAPDQ